MQSLPNYFLWSRSRLRWVFVTLIRLHAARSDLFAYLPLSLSLQHWHTWMVGTLWRFALESFSLSFSPQRSQLIKNNSWQIFKRLKTSTFIRYACHLTTRLTYKDNINTLLLRGTVLCWWLVFLYNRSSYTNGHWAACLRNQQQDRYIQTYSLQGNICLPQSPATTGVCKFADHLRSNQKRYREADRETSETKLVAQDVRNGSLYLG